MLDEVKEIYGGLYQFLIISTIFSVETSGVNDYWVGLEDELVNEALDKAKGEASLSEAENEFFQYYSIKRLQNKQKYFEFTMKGLGLFSDEPVDGPSQVQPQRNEPDFSQMKVVELKEICREKGLMVTGRKAELLERIRASDEMIEQEELSPSPLEEELKSLNYLEELLLEYLHASGGKASSRDVGRYLTANKPSTTMTAQNPTITSALSELKHVYGSLRQFIAQSVRFQQVEMEGRGKHEFLVLPVSR